MEVQEHDEKKRPLYYKWFAGELGFIFILIIASVLIPSLKAELFPYSSFALFTDSPKLYVEYEIKDGSGKKISPKEVALQRNYYGISPREPYARVKPFSYDKFGHVLKEDTIREAIKKSLGEGPSYKFPILVRQKVFEMTSSGVKNTKTFNTVITRESETER